MASSRSKRRTAATTAAAVLWGAVAGTGPATAAGDRTVAGGERLGRQAILYLSFREGNDDIYVTDLGGGGERRLTDHPAMDAAPMASPDRRTIAFASERDGLMQLYLMDADGGNERGLLTSDSFDYWPIWSPDGSRIMFQRRSASTGFFDVWTMRADGTDVAQLTSLPRNEVGPVFSPDGTLVSFMGNNGTSQDIWVVPSSGGQPAALTAGTCITGTDPCVLASDIMPSWTPDGRLLFVSNRSGGTGVWSMAADGSDVRLVRDFGTASVAMPSMSANGHWITLVTNAHDPGGPRNLHVMRHDGTHLRLLNDEGDDLTPKFASSPRV